MIQIIFFQKVSNKFKYFRMRSCHQFEVKFWRLIRKVSQKSENASKYLKQNNYISINSKQLEIPQYERFDDSKCFQIDRKNIQSIFNYFNIVQHSRKIKAMSNS